MEQRRVYKVDKLPVEEDLSRFAIPYTPEKFTLQEKRCLAPFFTNIDKPVFALKNLPEEVSGALSSRYSRSAKSLRRIFLDEYVAPILYPQNQKDWAALTREVKSQKSKVKSKFLETIDFLNKGGGIEEVVNIQRGRKFFDTWLSQYGDDSIAEMGGVHLCIEGLSNVAVKEIEDKRIGISPLEKSTRYVQFWDKRPDGGFQYLVPGEIKETEHEKHYKEALDMLFDTYTGIAAPYLEYIKQRYPQGEDETEKSFQNSRSAKRFDDIRDLLPFATQTQAALFGNGRAYEDLINRLLFHPLGEIRWLGQQICRELEKVVPSFVSRPKTERGALLQIYRTNLKILKNEAVENLITRGVLSGTPLRCPKKWVNLLFSTLRAEDEVLSAFLFGDWHDAPLSAIREIVGSLKKSEKTEMLKELLNERRMGNEEAGRAETRFRKVPRAFENAHFLFEIWGRGGDYRDLMRHRMCTQDRQRFTCAWGYDLEKEVLQSPFADKIVKALRNAQKVFYDLEKHSADAAQYAVPFAFLTHWYMNLSAREIYWMTELRTGPQGRPHYRKICQQIAVEAKKAAPALFSGLMADMNNYSLARRESEKRVEKKLKTAFLFPLD